MPRTPDYGQRRAPSQLGPAGRHRLDREQAADLVGALAEVGQSAPCEVRPDATAVVDDLDAQVVLDVDVDGRAWWRSRAARRCSPPPGQPPRHDRRGRRQPPTAARRTAPSCASPGRRTARWPPPAVAAAASSPDWRAVQIEDRGADLLDDLLQVVDAVGKSLLHLGRPCARDRSLQRRARRRTTAGSRGRAGLGRCGHGRSGCPARACCRWVLASCQATAAWSAKAAIMSSCSALNGCAPTGRSATKTPATMSVAAAAAQAPGRCARLRRREVDAVESPGRALEKCLTDALSRRRGWSAPPRLAAARLRSPTTTSSSTSRRSARRRRPVRPPAWALRR